MQHDHIDERKNNIPRAINIICEFLFTEFTYIQQINQLRKSMRSSSVSEYLIQPIELEHDISQQIQNDIDLAEIFTSIHSLTIKYKWDVITAINQSFKIQSMCERMLKEFKSLVEEKFANKLLTALILITRVVNYRVATESLSRLASISENLPMINKALTELSSQPLDNDHDLEFISRTSIVPLQRYPRYKLLLTELIQVLPQDQDAQQLLQEWQEKAQACIQGLNEEIRKREHKEAVKISPLPQPSQPHVAFMSGNPAGLHTRQVKSNEMLMNRLLIYFQEHELPHKKDYKERLDHFKQLLTLIDNEEGQKIKAHISYAKKHFSNLFGTPGQYASILRQLDIGKIKTLKESDRFAIVKASLPLLQARHEQGTNLKKK